MLRSFRTWETTNCDSCGCEYQVTRTNPKELEECICNDCEIYAKAYKEGFEDGAASVKPRY